MKMHTTTYLVVALFLNSVLSHKIVEPLLHKVGLDHYEYPRYAYDYAVHDPHTGDHKHQWEERDGDFVRGEYGLVEPDGSLRVVQYTSHPKHGFKAEVKKIGPSIHPEVHHYHHLHQEHIIPPLVPLDVSHELIPIITKPLGKRYTHAIKKVLSELPLAKKVIIHEEPLFKQVGYKPFKPLKHFIDNIVKKPLHEKPIYSLFEPYAYGYQG